MRGAFTWSCFEVEREGKEMPLFICILFAPLLIALFVALKASGRKKVLAWCVFALLALPLLVGGAGGWLLSLRGLAWRSGVKLPVGFAYAAGVLALLVWAGAALWRDTGWWRSAVRSVGRCAILLVGGFLILAAGWYCLLFAAIWAGGDMVTEYDGQTAVAEQTWMDWDYYAYHGPLVRGEDALGHSSRVPASKEPERTEQELDAKARKKAGRALGLDIPDSGEVQRRDDTHGGFHNDGETYIQIRFNEDSGAVLEQIEASAEWTALPLPKELRTLGELMNEVWLPTDEELGEGYYWFQDRHSEAKDRRDYNDTLERRSSYNFTMAFYSIGEKTLCFCVLDT